MKIKVILNSDDMQVLELDAFSVEVNTRETVYIEADSNTLTLVSDKDD